MISKLRVYPKIQPVSQEPLMPEKGPYYSTLIGTEFSF